MLSSMGSHPTSAWLPGGILPGTGSVLQGGRGLSPGGAASLSPLPTAASRQAEQGPEAGRNLGPAAARTCSWGSAQGPNVSSSSFSWPEQAAACCGFSCRSSHWPSNPPPPANGNREPWAHTSRVTLWGSGHGGAALSHPLPSGAPQTGPEWGRLHSWPQHSSTVPWLHSRHNAGAPLAITPMWGARGMCVWGARPGSARHSQSLRVPTAAVSGCQRWRSQRPNKQGLSATRQPACRRAWPDAAFPFVRS